MNWIWTQWTLNIAEGWWRVATNPDKKQVWATSVEDEVFEAWTHNAVTPWYIILCSDAPEANKGCACPRVTPAETAAAPLWKATASAKQQQQQLWPAFSSAAHLDPLKSMLVHARKDGRNHLRSVIMPPRPNRQLCNQVSCRFFILNDNPWLTDLIPTKGQLLGVGFPWIS